MRGAGLPQVRSSRNSDSDAVASPKKNPKSRPIGCAHSPVVRSLMVMDNQKTSDLPETAATLGLLRQGVEGDREAMVQIWNAHRDRLLKLVKLRMDRRLQGRVDAEDVLQETFVDFASRAEKYLTDSSMPFYLWLRFLTGQRLQLIHRHHLGTRMRDAGREVSLHRGAMPQATSISLAAQLLGRFTSVTHAVQRAEMQQILQEAVNAMDPLDREILALRHFEELSNAETAELLDIKTTTASTRHIRALKRLREQLKGTPGFFDTKRE
jgi:RNA polymerase sigma-70 factor (ECF subfamily)